MKTSTRTLALSDMLASPVAAYAGESPNLINAIEGLFTGSGHSQRVSHETGASQWCDPFKPRTTDGLSRNRNACASYGCVGVGGD
jgi:hypothetical protein